MLLHRKLCAVYTLPCVAVLCFISYIVYAASCITLSEGALDDLPSRRTMKSPRTSRFSPRGWAWTAFLGRRLLISEKSFLLKKNHEKQKKTPGKIAERFSNSFILIIGKGGVYLCCFLSHPTGGSQQRICHFCMKTKPSAGKQNLPTCKRMHTRPFGYPRRSSRGFCERHPPFRTFENPN